MTGNRLGNVAMKLRTIGQPSPVAKDSAVIAGVMDSLAGDVQRDTSALEKENSKDQKLGRSGATADSHGNRGASSAPSNVESSPLRATHPLFSDTRPDTLQ